MDTWNRLIHFRGGGDHREDWKRLAKEDICIYAKPMDTNNDVVKGGGWGLDGEEKCSKMGNICNSLENKKR